MVCYIKEIISLLLVSGCQTFYQIIKTNYMVSEETEKWFDLNNIFKIYKYILSKQLKLRNGICKPMDRKKTDSGCDYKTHELEIKSYKNTNFEKHHSVL